MSLAWTEEDEWKAQAEDKETREAAKEKAVDDYFGGQKGNQPHMKWTSTGSEGFCELCGYRESYLHDAYNKGVR